MKDFEYILEKVLSDKKFSRSEKEALDKVLKAGDYNHHQLAELRSQLFDHIKEQFQSKEERDLIDCLEGLNKALLPKAPKQQANSMAEAHFSPGFECQGAINRQMRNAKKSIDICVFTISDNQIVDEILKAHKRGIEVRIVTDDDKQHDKGNDVFRMKGQGIPVATDSAPDHMHHKFAVFDKRTLIVGSYNWTRSAATRNNEDIVVMDDKNVVDSFNKEFERLWKEFY